MDNHLSTVKMSLNDKILEILEKKPMSSTKDIQYELEKEGAEKNLRTIQRHMKKLYEEHKITIAAYDRKKRRPLYIVRVGAEYKSIMDFPEISEVDWGKTPKEDILRICALWQIKQGYNLKWLQDDIVRLMLKSYIKNGDSKSLKEKIDEIKKKKLKKKRN